MAQRSYKVVLDADYRDLAEGLERSAKAADSLSKSMDKVGKSMPGRQFEDSGRQSRRASEDFDKSTKSLGGLAQMAEKNSGALNDLGNTATVAGAGLAAVFAYGAKSFAEFDKSMSGVAAALPDAAAQMGALREQAIQLGADSQFSASEAADGITELGKAGVSAADILSGGLKGSLDLAAAGQLSVADAAELAATAVTQFGLTGRDVTHVADLYAAAAGKAQGSAADIGEAMKFVGPVAKAMGLSIEETTGAIAEFASQGIIGEQAGTSLRGVLLSLTAPSKAANDVMDKYSLSLYDSNGGMKSLSEIAGELQNRLGGLDEATRNQALGQIFGNAQVTAAIALMQGGSAAVDKWTTAVNDSGFAARQAATLTDNLAGDWERLGGAADSAFVQNGSAVNGALRGMVQGLTGAVDAFSELPTWVQQSTVGLTAFASVGLLAVGGLAKGAAAVGGLVDSVKSVNSAMSEANISLGAIATNPWALALAGAAAIATIAVGSFVKSQIDAKRYADELRASLDQQTGAITDNTRARVATDLQGKGAFEWARKAGVDLKVVTDAALGNTDAIRTLREAQDGAAQSAERLSGGAKAVFDTMSSGEPVFGGLSGSVFDTATASEKAGDAALEQAGALEQLIGIVGPSAQALGAQVEQTKEIAEATGSAAGETDGLSGGIDDIGQAAAEAQADVDELTDSIKGLGSSFRDERGAMREQRAAIADLAEAAKSGKASYDDLEAAADQVAQATLDAAATAVKNGKSQADVTKIVNSGADALRKNAAALGLKKGAVEALIAQEGLTPEQVITLFQTPGLVDAIEKSKGLNGSLAAQPAQKSTNLSVPGAAESKTRVDNVRSAIDDLRGKSVTVRADTSQAQSSLASLNQMMDAFHNRAPLSVRMPGVALPAKAEGGRLVGQGTGTSDEILLLGSNGEYMVRQRAAEAIGYDRLDYMNETGKLPAFAGGGRIGDDGIPRYANGGTVSASNYASISALATALANPLRDLATATAAYTAAARAIPKAPSNQGVLAAKSAEAQAKRNLDAAKKVKVTGKTKAAKDAAQKQKDKRIADAQAMLNRRTAEREKAEKSYQSALEKSRDAVDKAREAERAMRAERQDLADAARRSADSVRSPFEEMSTDPATLLAIRQRGTGQIAALDSQIAQLRSKGLSQTLIDQIVNYGAANGGALATSLLADKTGLIGKLNAAQESLSGASDRLGLTANNLPDTPTLAKFAKADLADITNAVRVGAMQGISGRRYDTGGYTGAGAKQAPAGEVHGGEFVHPKAQVDQPGMLAFHTDLWASGDLDLAYARHRRRGYASGGHVGWMGRPVAAPGTTAVTIAGDFGKGRDLSDRDIMRLANAMAKVQLTARISARSLDQVQAVR